MSICTKCYHKLTTVNAVNFAGLIFHVCRHKNIFAGCTTIIPWYIYKQLGSIKTKQASHIFQYITHLHQHTWSIHNSYVSQMCMRTKYWKYFRGFLNSRLPYFVKNSRKLMYREYYHVYSNLHSIDDLQNVLWKSAKLYSFLILWPIFIKFLPLCLYFRYL